MQIKDIDNDLWQGFNHITHNDGCHAWIHNKVFKITLMDTVNVVEKFKQGLLNKYNLK